MDRGLWVTWYNLREDGREDYLVWLPDMDKWSKVIRTAGIKPEG